MAVQWLGNIKPTGRGNLARDIGSAVQPAVNVYADYLAKTKDREKSQVKEFITEIKKSSGKERESLWAEFQTHPKFRKTVEEQASWLLGEGKFNVAQNWEKVGIVGTKMILTDGDTTKTIDMGEDIDFDKYKLDYRPDGKIAKVNQRTGVSTIVGEAKKIYSTSKNTITLDDGTVRTVHRITYTDGNVDETIDSAGINAELKGLEMSIEARAEIATLDREQQDEWKTKEFQNKKDILAFSVSESLRDQKNIVSKTKTEKEMFDANLKETGRQFDVGNALALHRLSQDDEQFWAKMDHQIDIDMKRLNIDKKYKNAIRQDMEDKINLAHDNYDLSKVKVNQEFINTSIELDQRQQQLDIALNESEWSIKAIKAKMNQYQSIGPLFAEDGKTIIGATGLRWDPKTEEYVTEQLENVPVSVAKLMIQQQVLELEGNEQDNILKAQGYSGLAAGVYGAVRNAKIPSMDSADAWSSTAYTYAEKYAEGNEDVTAESAYGRILVHAYNMNWIDEDKVATKELIYTDEAFTAFNKEQTQWKKDNPIASKREDTPTVTNPNPMSGGLQVMTPEDNQLKSLLNNLLGNDILYNNLKSAVTLPEQAGNLPAVPSDFGTIANALSDIKRGLSNAEGRVENYVNPTGKASGAGTGRRTAEYTKDIKNPAWENLIQLLGLGGGSE